MPAPEIEGDAVIIGASVAGLATAACLKRVAVPFVLLEEGREVAPAWRRHYDRLHLHTSKAFSQLPYFPFPRNVPRYPARADVVAYLESYARHFGLFPRFGQRVLSVRRDREGWLTCSEDTAYRSANVVIATGYTRVPNRPDWPGLKSFAGPVVHSSEYRNGKTWAGYRVLVIGIGNSGGEIAIDLCEHGARPGLSVRGAVNIVPRDFLGLPILAWTIALSFLPGRLADAIARLVSRIAFGRIEALGLRRPAYGPMAQIWRNERIPLLDVGTVARIRRREIEVMPGVESFTERGARFVDGIERPFDAVLLATGFRPGLASFLEVAPGLLKENGVPTQSGAETLPGLYFCGFHLAATGMFREIALESKRIANSIVNKERPASGLPRGLRWKYEFRIG